MGEYFAIYKLIEKGFEEVEKASRKEIEELFGTSEPNKV